MIRRLHAGLGIPAEVLIRPPMAHAAHHLAAAVASHQPGVPPSRVHPVSSSVFLARTTRLRCRSAGFPRQAPRPAAGTERPCLRKVSAVESRSGEGSIFASSGLGAPASSRPGTKSPNFRGLRPRADRMPALCWRGRSNTMTAGGPRGPAIGGGRRRRSDAFGQAGLVDAAGNDLPGSAPSGPRGTVP